MDGYRFLVLIIAVTSVQSVHVDEGCEVKSEWKIEYEWSDFQVSTWVSKESLSPILTLDVEFDGHHFPLTYDTVEIKQKEIQVERIRDARSSSVTNQTSYVVGEGWVDFEFTLNSQYILKYGTDVMQLGSVDYLPKSLTIKGSNITVNCQSGMRTWKMSNGPKSVPLDNCEEHLLSFYSTEEFLPIIEVELRDFPFGWNDETLTTIPSLAKSLPPFVLHNLTIICRKGDETICQIMTGKEMRIAEEYRVRDIPRSVTVRREQVKPFHVFLHKGCSLTANEDDSSEPVSVSYHWRCVVWSASAAAVISILLIICIIFTWRKEIHRWAKEVLCKSGVRKKTFAKNKVDAENPEKSSEEKQPLKC